MNSMNENNEFAELDALVASQQPKISATPNDLLGKVHNRLVFIYGVSVNGLGYLRRLKYFGLEVGGFIDSYQFVKSSVNGLPVYHPDDFLRQYNHHNSFVFVCVRSVLSKKQVSIKLSESGFVRGEDYIIFSDLCGFYPSIEVSGICNLHCITCGYGLPGANRGKGMMSASTFEKVISKLVAEIPFLDSVYLYLWGEPLLNKELPQIVHIAHEHGVAVEISTNLMDVRNLEPLIAEEPDFVIVACAGTEERFEKYRTGAKWNKFLKNLYLLNELVKRYGSKTVVRIQYHIYRDNLYDDFDKIKALAQNFGFGFKPIVAQIFPDYVVRSFLENKDLPLNAQKAGEYLYFSINECIEFGRSFKNLKCRLIKAFPNIRWDTSVIQCCNLEGPQLSGSFLEKPLSDFIKERVQNKFCSMCIKHGMHYYFYTDAIVEEKDGERIVVRNI